MIMVTVITFFWSFMRNPAIQPTQQFSTATTAKTPYYLCRYLVLLSLMLLPGLLFADEKGRKDMREVRKEVK